MKLKVCGMRDPENIKAVSHIGPDWMGFIFYPKSPRYVGNELDTNSVDESIKRVGVFVNESVEEVKRLVGLHGLSLVQLHGDEGLDYVNDLKEAGIEVMKVFRVDDQLPIEEIKKFAPLVSYFLFDTKTKDYGGSGKKFDWSILNQYPVDVPFWLSGGVSVADIEEIRSLQIAQLEGIDVNSKVEDSPGVKNIELVRELREAI